MIALVRRFHCAPWRAALCLVAVLAIMLPQQPAHAINILVDYRYDTNTFFNTAEKRSAIEAAASRCSQIITTQLLGVNLVDDNVDPRIGFTHPATGLSYQISSAGSQATDVLVQMGIAAAADEYRSSAIAADQWLLFAGGRPMPAGMTSVGGTRTGTNLSVVFTNGASHLNRGFRPSGSPTVPNLPVWGGSVSFDSDGSTPWHFNHTTAPPAGTADLYTFAVHEIGHALGLNTGTWVEWTSHIAPGTVHYTGQAVTTYNADNGASRTSLSVADDVPLNAHWQNNAFDSFIFQNANPNLVDSVGWGEFQDLLMEPAIESGRRLELTNVDVAALRDVGWSTVPQISVQAGDFDRSGGVTAADYIVQSKGLFAGSLATWRANYGESVPPALAADFLRVPEPSSAITVGIACVVILSTRCNNTQTRCRIAGSCGERGDDDESGGRVLS